LSCAPPLHKFARQIVNQDKKRYANHEYFIQYIAKWRDAGVFSSGVEDAGN